MTSKTQDPRHAQTLKLCNSALTQLWATSAWQAPRHVLALEAGGGSFSHFSLPSQSILLTVDIDHGQLQRNYKSQFKVQADLHALPLRPNTIDIAVCFNVIEHLDNPELALTQLALSLSNGGILVLGCPDRKSLKGLVTRLSPVGWHRAFYRFIVRKADRGDGHFDAFPTPFRSLVTHERLLESLKLLGFKVIFSAAYDGAYEYGLTQGSWLRRCFGAPYYLLGNLFHWISLGHWHPLNSDLLFVAQKVAESE
jgi:SAM-dependent methyltransferase